MPNIGDLQPTTTISKTAPTTTQVKKTTPTTTQMTVTTPVPKLPIRPK
jgi:hypothetical protein